MIEDRKSDQDRWQELAALLGLPPDGQPPAPKVESKPSSPPHRYVQPEAPPPEEDEGPSYPVEIATAAAVEINDDWVEEAAPPAEAVETQEEPQDTRRRRGGRGGRGRKRAGDEAEGRDRPPAEPALTTQEAAGREGASDGTEDESGTPRRGRKRRRKSGRPDEDAPATVQAQNAEAPGVEEEDDDEPGAKWDLPSWEELIASLKRP